MFKINGIHSGFIAEGSLIGRAAVFVRFTGCNLWLRGHRSSRPGGPGTCARWCTAHLADDADTRDMGAEGIIHEAFRLICADREGEDHPTGPMCSGYVLVLTGGEPMVQLIRRSAEASALITMARAMDLEVLLETNGTIPIPPDLEEGISFIKLSPKRLNATTTPSDEWGHLRVWSCHDLVIPVPMVPDQLVEDLLRRVERQGLYFQPVQLPMVAQRDAELAMGAFMGGRHSWASARSTIMEECQEMARRYAGRVAYPIAEWMGLP